MSTTTRFELHRGRLLGLAYRMLGSRADAEDIVQDAWIKWSQSDRCAIENDEAYLTTVVTRLCLDRVKRERPRRRDYVGPWLPEPVMDAHALSPQAGGELADDLSFALLLALECLSPLERAAFLLHDVFDTPFAEVATTLRRSEAAVRQLAARARRAVRQKKPQRSTTREAHARLFDVFLTALASGDAEQLKALLSDDAISIADAGGQKPAVPHPIRGADRVARLYTGLLRKFSRAQGPPFGHSVRTWINGGPALLVHRDGIVVLMLTISVDNERIAAIYAVRNPEKLARLGRTDQAGRSFAE